MEIEGENKRKHYRSGGNRNKQESDKQSNTVKLTVERMQKKESLLQKSNFEKKRM